MIVEGADGFAAPFFQNGKRKRQRVEENDVKRKAKLYGPVLLAALLCALVFATGALKKPKIFENITTDYMVFQKKQP